MAAHVFDKHENFSTGISQRAAVHCAGALVDGFVAPHVIQQDVKRALREGNVIAQFDGIDFFHQVAEHRALTAAGGDRALLHFLREILQAFARGDYD